VPEMFGRGNFRRRDFAKREIEMDTFKTWKQAHTNAVALARLCKCDVGVWKASQYGQSLGFRIGLLPRPENRSGRELQCEVVHPDDPR
jgi:hypothetical protein